MGQENGLNRISAPVDGNSRTIMEASILRKKIYSDATYTYVCSAAPGTALTASSWQIKRIDADGSVDFAGGAPTFQNAATNLTAVQGYSYS